MPKLRLRLQQASMLNEVERPDVADDLMDAIFSRDSDFIGFTEIGQNPLNAALHRAARERGYYVLEGPGGDGIAVKKEHKRLDGGFIRVLDAPSGGEGARGVWWVKANVDGQIVFFHTMHWVNDMESNPVRREQWMRQSEAMIRKVAHGGKARPALSFFSGDLNVHLQNHNTTHAQTTRSMFNGGGLNFVWDEVSRFPDTGPHGGTIDVIGRFREAEGKVVNTNVHRLNGADHAQIEAVYEITVPAKTEGGQGGGGGGQGGGGGNPSPQPSPYNPPPAGPPPNQHPAYGKGRASLGGRKFRINPTSVRWNYSTKTADLATVGGKVVQVFGTTMGNIFVTGTFGEGGWREQERFLDRMKELGEKPIDRPGAKPPRFKYPAYGWDFPVYLKGYTTPDGGRSVVLDNQIVAPRWTLELFPVEKSASLNRIAQDAYLDRIAQGLGWKQTKYNGPKGMHDTLGGMSVEDYLEAQYGLGGVPTGNQDPPSPDIVPIDGAGGGTPAKNKALGKSMAHSAGWSGSQWDALLELWMRESSWNHQANNPTSSAYGIPQALVDAHEPMPKNYYQSRTGSGETATFSGGDPEVQIRWGLNYIRNRYGNPVAALAFHNANGWY